MNGTVESFAATMLKYIREERARFSDMMSKGVPNDFHEYKVMLGQIKCLDSVENRLKQLIEAHSGDENEF